MIENVALTLVSSHRLGHLKLVNLWRGLGRRDYDYCFRKEDTEAHKVHLMLVNRAQPIISGIQS